MCCSGTSTTAAGTGNLCRQHKDVGLVMPVEYAELHCKSFYSFGQGASHVHELLALAAEYGYPALALTDTNLCGALEFARLANSLGIKPISGCELTLIDNSRLTLLARTREGYANMSQLLTLANSLDRREPRLDPTYLPAHAEGTVLLTGGRDSLISRLIQQGRQSEALAQLRRYMDWYGLRLRVHRTSAEFFAWGYEAQQAACQYWAGGRYIPCSDE